MCYKGDVQHANLKSLPARIASNKPFSYRVPKHLAPSFNDVVAVSQRQKASIIHESLSARLPMLETRYADQLKKLRNKKSAEK